MKVFGFRSGRPFFCLIYSYVRHTGYGYRWIGCLIEMLNDSRQYTWASLFLLTYLQYILFATTIHDYLILCDGITLIVTTPYIRMPYFKI